MAVIQNIACANETSLDKVWQEEFILSCALTDIGCTGCTRLTSAKLLSPIIFPRESFSFFSVDFKSETLLHETIPGHLNGHDIH